MLLEFVLPHLGKQDLLNVALIEHTIDEASLSEFLGLHITHCLVSQRLKCLNRDITRRRDVLHHLIPNIAKICLDLQTICVADVLHHIRLNGTLELSYAEYLHLDVEFVKQPFGICQDT